MNKTEDKNAAADQLSNDNYDIVIVGGGMVGISQALLLAGQNPNWRIALIERFAFPEKPKDELYQPSFDARSTAISLGSIEIFKSLGLWETLVKHCTLIKTVHVSDRGHVSGATICHKKQGVDMLGAVLENAWLGQVLLQELRQKKQIKVYDACEVEQLDMRLDCAFLRLQQKDIKQSLTAKLLCLADGGDSPLAQQLGLHRNVQDYGQSAIIATVEVAKPHQGVAYERFTEQGPMALLPMGEDEQARRCALVWTVPNESLEDMLVLDESKLLGLLQQRFGYRLGRILKIGQRQSYPLQLTVISEQVRSSLVVLGNAAHYLHPVAGQGFNLALRDSVALTEALLDAEKEGDSLGSLKVLKSYLARQQLDQDLTINFSDQIVKMFSSQSFSKQLFRSAGFVSLALFPEAKQFLAKQTMGTAGRLSRMIGKEVV